MTAILNDTLSAIGDTTDSLSLLAPKMAMVSMLLAEYDRESTLEQGLSITVGDWLHELTELRDRLDRAHDALREVVYAEEAPKSEPELTPAEKLEQARDDDKRLRSVADAMLAKAERAFAESVMGETEVSEPEQTKVEDEPEAA